MKIPPRSTIVFAGDSITFANRDPDGEPTPWHREGGLGQGYVNFIYAILTSTRPQDRYRVINRGHNGWTAKNLDDSWEDLALSFKPKWISIMIGINDVWRQFDCPLKTENYVSPEAYEATVERLIVRSLPKVQGLVLMTPFVIEANATDSFRVQMDRYGAIVRRLADKHQTVFVDTQAAFNAILEHRAATEIAWDRIHCDGVGHMAIARAWLDAVGFQAAGANEASVEPRG